MYDQPILEEQVRMTEPDYRLFIPRQRDWESDNEHIHVFLHEQFGGLIAIWTQSSVEGAGDNHAVISHSKDHGKTWIAPQYIVGAMPSRDKKEKQASWAWPVVSLSGRIYLFYQRETDDIDNYRSCSAVLSCMYSDDFGDTWSESGDIPQPITGYDSGEVQNNIIFQMPARTADGKYLVGYTKNTSLKIKAAKANWWEADSRIFFMRLENIDDDPGIDEIQITFFQNGGDGISVPLPSDPMYSVAQEPSVVILPDGRLFCSLRTAAGCVYYCISENLGEIWSAPKPLRFDDGSLFVHPLSPCPIYELEKGRYIQLYHGTAENIGASRNPLMKVYGTYCAEDEQPIRFVKGTEEVFMEIPKDDPFGRHCLAMYSSCTHMNGKHVLWYPERKFFVLGKEI